MTISPPVGGGTPSLRGQVARRHCSPRQVRVRTQSPATRSERSSHTDATSPGSRRRRNSYPAKSALSAPRRASIARQESAAMAISRWTAPLSAPTTSAIRVRARASSAANPASHAERTSRSRGRTTSAGSSSRTAADGAVRVIPAEAAARATAARDGGCPPSSGGWPSPSGTADPGGRVAHRLEGVGPTEGSLSVWGRRSLGHRRRGRSGRRRMRPRSTVIHRESSTPWPFTAGSSRPRRRPGGGDRTLRRGRRRDRRGDRSPPHTNRDAR